MLVGRTGYFVGYIVHARFERPYAFTEAAGKFGNALGSEEKKNHNDDNYYFAGAEIEYARCHRIWQFIAKLLTFHFINAEMTLKIAKK